MSSLQPTTRTRHANSTSAPNFTSQIHSNVRVALKTAASAYWTTVVSSAILTMSWISSLSPASTAIAHRSTNSTTLRLVHASRVLIVVGVVSDRQLLVLRVLLLQLQLQHRPIFIMAAVLPAVQLATSLTNTV